MDDKEMIEKLNHGAKIKLMTSEMLADVPRISLLPERVHEKMLAGERGAELMLPVGEDSRLEAGYLALAAKLLEGEEELDAASTEALCAKLREMADSDVDYADRTKDEIEEVDYNDEMDEDEKEEEKFTLESQADDAREDAEFYRAVADRLSEPAKP